MDLSRRLKGLAARSGATLYQLLLAAFNVLIHKYTRQEDIIVGSPAAGRTLPDLNHIIGMFVNTLPMRNYPAGGKTFLEFLEEVKQNSIEAFDNQDYPYVNLVQRLGIPRDSSRNPLFDVMFVLQSAGTADMKFDGLEMAPYRMENSTSQFDLTLEAEENGQEVEFTLEYSKKLFLPQTINRMIGHFLNILGQITDNPVQRLSDIEIITPAEKEQVLAGFNDTRLEYPADKTIHRLFEEMAQKYPDKTALVYKDERLTYRELNQRANRLAGVLRQKGIGPDDVAAIMVGRSQAIVIGALAVMKAGGAYLPIDPGYPMERIGYMLEDSRAKILLSQKHLAESGLTWRTRTYTRRRSAERTWKM